MAIPTDLSGLILWLKADSLVLNDTDPVATWSDSSGNGNNATQSVVANQPTYRTNQVNGKPVVDFDGTNDVLVTLLAQPATVTVFVMYINYNLNSLYSTNSGAASAPFQRENFSWYSNTVGQVSLSENLTTNNIMGLTFDYNTNNYFFYMHGAQVGAATTAASNPGGNIVLGARNGDQEFTAADIAEVIVYNRILSTFERAQIDTYLSDKYRITVGDYLSYTYRQYRIPNNKVGPMAMRQKFRLPAQKRYQANAPVVTTRAQNNMPLLGVG